MKITSPYSWFLVALWCALIFYLSSIPNLKVTPDTFWDFIFRKIAHFGVYAILYLLIYNSTRKRLLSFFLTIIYAASDELHQHFVPTRSGSPRDWLIDSSGALLANLFLPKLLKLKLLKGI